MRVLLPFLILGLLAPFVEAQGHSKGKNKPTYGITVVMEQDQNGDGLPNWNDSISYDVGTAVENPWVTTNCYQGSNWVMAAGGWRPEWPLSLAATPSWPEHTAADCTVTLYTTIDGLHTKTLATLDFHVNP